MKKVILISSLIFLHLGYVHAMEQIPAPSADASNQSTAVVRVVETESSAPLVVQMNIDTFRTIIRDTIHDVLGERLSADNEAMINMISRVAAGGVKREHLAQMQAFATRAQAQMDLTRDAYEHELEDLRTQNRVLREQRDQAEQVKTLRGILLRIPVADKTPIMLRAINMLDLNIFERHRKLEELYKRFLPYSELFGRADLGVVATSADMNTLRTYMSDTAVDEHPQLLPPVNARLLNFRFYVPLGEYQRGIALAPKAAQPNMVFRQNAAFFARLAESKNFSTIVNTKIAAINQQRTDSYNAEKARASAAVFPSESFNRLVDQVNRFFTEGFQDIH